MAPGILVKPQPKFLQGISSSLPVVFIALALCQQEITAVLIFSILEAQIYQFSVYVHFFNLFLLYLKEKVLKCRLYLETVN